MIKFGCEFCVRCELDVVIGLEGGFVRFRWVGRVLDGCFGGVRFG